MSRTVLISLGLVALAIVLLALSFVPWGDEPAETIAPGRLYLDRRPRPFDRLPGTRVSLAERIRLWDVVVALAGVRDPAPEAAR